MWVGTGAAAGQSATITFGTSQAVTRVEVFNTGFVQGGVTTDFRIQYSTNGVDFIDIITKTGLTLSDWNTGNNGTLPECVACLAWRFNF